MWHNAPNVVRREMADMTSSKTTRKARRSPIVWIILSAMLFVIYAFSVSVRTQWQIVRSGRYVSALLADGRLAVSTHNEPMWADNHSIAIEKVNWSPEIKFLPKWEQPAAGSYAAVAPLWLVALPVWVVTFVKWRRSRRVDGNVCRKCGYDLRAQGDSERCPECGAARMVA